MDGDLGSQEISTSATSVVLNGSVFNFSALPGEGEKGEFDTVTPSGLTMSVIPEQGTGNLQGLLVDTSRGLAVLSVGGDGVGVGHVSLNVNGMVGNLQGGTVAIHLQALLSPSVLHPEHGTAHHLFEEHGDVSSDSQALNTTADPNELQLVTSSTPASVGVVSTTNSLEEEPKKKRGGWPKGKKRKPEKESLAPKAPASGYVLFAVGRRPLVREENPNLSFVEITKVLGNEWSSMPMEEKQKYMALAEADKQRYISELKSYQQSEAYQNYLKKKKVKDEGEQQSQLDSSTSDSSYVADIHSEELYCKVCDMYFSSHHNRKEHMFGKQHLQNVTSEFETELKKEKDEQHQQQHQQQQQQQQLAESEAVTSDLSQDAYTGPLMEHGDGGSDRLDVESFVQRFMQKNYDRELEIMELRKSLHVADKNNMALMTKIEELKEVECNLEQDLGTLKAYGASLNAQIDGLKMVPTLFGVINF